MSGGPPSSGPAQPLAGQDLTAPPKFHDAGAKPVSSYLPPPQPAENVELETRFGFTPEFLKSLNIRGPVHTRIVVENLETVDENKLRKFSDRLVKYWEFS